ncbi:MAG: hypothetical protein IPI28_18235 [Candidatus Omnitrophica bacterium]|nr:hypothetical protein [Candidatus Omnitrophota bacterium]
MTLKAPIILLVSLFVEVAMAQGSMVAVGPGGFLSKDGKKIFAIGAYNGPKGIDPQGIAAMGFNVLRIGEDPAEWGSGSKAGLMAWHPLDLAFEGEGIDARKAKVSSMIEKYRDHPNLFMWESVDEPAWTDEKPELARVESGPLIEGYRLVKSLDRNHPVYLNHAPRNTIDTMRRYNRAGDILCVDVYPVVPPVMDKLYAIIQPPFPGGIARQTDFPDTSPACVGDYVDKMKQVAYQGHPVFVVLQGFAWEGLRKQEERVSERILYPTYEQLRFMAWQAIIHGVNGITVWGLSYADNQDFLSDLSAVLNEVRGNEETILGGHLDENPVIRYEEMGYSIGKGIECRVTETADKATLFTVNAGVDPLSAKFVSLPVCFEGAAELVVLGENRSVKIENSGFRDSYSGLGVHIYQFSR